MTEGIVPTNYDDLVGFYASQKEPYWASEGPRKALSLFQHVVATVPGYKDFLVSSGIDPASITTIEDFKRLPTIDKKNYMSVERLADTVLSGDLSGTYLLCKSSGSTGKAFYWPRYKEQDQLESSIVEAAYTQLGVHKRSTLVINCLALGTWVAGTMMTDTSLDIAKKPQIKMSVITPGAGNTKEVLEIVNDIGHHYDQILIIAYPPTARNIIVEGIEAGVDWSKYKPKFVVGGEAVSVPWKRFMLSHVGSEDFLDIGVIFGMAELHVLAFENPLASLIRQWLFDHPKVSEKIFGSPALAALMQYDPTRRFIEEQDGELIITAHCGLPLIRYNSHDLGGVIGFGELMGQLEEAGYDIVADLAKSGYDKSSVWQLPFFYSLGRGDSISLMGANIYPRNMEAFFHAHKELNDYKIEASFDEAQQAHLVIHLELRPGKELGGEREAFIEQAQNEIFLALSENNADYADAYHEEPEVMMPRVVVYAFGEGPFVNKKIKQNHILKQ